MTITKTTIPAISLLNQTSKKYDYADSFESTIKIAYADLILADSLIILSDFLQATLNVSIKELLAGALR